MSIIPLAAYWGFVVLSAVALALIPICLVAFFRNEANAQRSGERRMAGL